MYLKQKQADKLYKLLFALAEYTNIEYEIGEGPITVGFGNVTPEQMNPILEFLWEHSEKIIDDFVLKNPFNFSFEELEIIQSWKRHVSGLFYPIENTKRGTVLMLDDEAFEVIGISNDIAEMIPVGEFIVKMTLLPFEGEIIYDAIISHQNTILGPNISKALSDNYEKLKADDAVVRDAKGLIRAAGRIKDWEFHKKHDENDSVLENEQVPITTHEGVLAGLSEIERLCVIEEKLMDTLEQAKRELIELVVSRAYRCEPTTDMEACLNLMGKNALVEFAKEAGITYATKKRKAALAAELGDILMTPGGVGVMLGGFDQRGLDFLEEVIANGGALSLTRDEANLQDPKVGLEPLIFTFLTGTTFSFNGEVLTYALPDGVADAYNRLKKTDYFANRRERIEIDGYAAAMTELYGVVSLDEFLEVYNEQHDAGEHLEKDRLRSKLISLVAADEKGYALWYFEGEDYLADYELVEIDLDEDEEADEDYDPLAFATYIAKRHHTIPMKKLSREELLKYPYSAIVKNTQEYKKLRRFLDSNIPDDYEKDELFFANRVLDELYDCFRWDVDIGTVMEFLSECGLVFDIDKTNIMLALVADVANNTPKWSNFGWTPHELFEKQGGWGRERAPSKAQDEGDDGFDLNTPEPYQREAQKIGRNEQCPCGSGKKYKNCCGRAVN